MTSAGGTAEQADRRCVQCAEANPARARFCIACGAPLSAAVPREERKLVSVLFVDLVGSTARADGADPEDVRETLGLYHESAKRRIEDYGGVLEKFIGDAVMAVFGAPVAHGDDAERAVRAGLRVLEGIGELNAEHGLDLEARAAVATGEAVVSVDPGRADAFATGDVVNTASRLQNAAPVGRLIVGAETHRATRHVIRYESSEPVDAKGKAAPVAAWVAVEPSLAPADRPILATVLVGREQELDLMASLWRRCVSESRPHLVTVTGPPGIGKSRLCREVSALVDGDGGRILRGRCLPYEEQAGYQAFSQHRLRRVRHPRVRLAARRAREAARRGRRADAGRRGDRHDALPRAPPRARARRRGAAADAALLRRAQLPRVHGSRSADAVRLRGRALGADAARSRCSST